MPRLTIINVNLNNAIGLRRTIKSVMIQTFSDFEYIIIDGGSTDGSREVLIEFTEKISYWISEKDDGIYNAMNKGILRAKGEYLLFLNSGDWLVDENILTKVFSSDYTEDIIYGDIILFDGYRQVVHHYPDKISFLYLYYKSLGHSCSFIRKNLFTKIGVYNEKLKIVSDWEFFVKAILINKCTTKHLPFPISVYDLKGISSEEHNKELILNEHKLVRQALFPSFVNDFPGKSHLFESPLVKVYNFLSSNGIVHNLLYGLIRLLVLIRQTINYRSMKKYSSRLYWRILEFLVPTRYKEANKIPVIINNFNRLACLKELISLLENKGITNIHIIDNCSTYPPLLKYYQEECKYKIYNLNKNVGQLALWETEVYKNFINDYYVYTDPDILPVRECPDDFMDYFRKQLKKYPRISKIGFSLKIDDLPDHYSKKNEVLKWEQQNYANKVQDGLYLASIDTTFAMYRPREKGDWNIAALRTDYPYQARHLPWYTNDKNLTEEDLYYSSSKKSNVGHWS